MRRLGGAHLLDITARAPVDVADEILRLHDEAQ